MFAAFAAMFSLITALVILSGYLVTCNELHYETRRQVLGKTTLGKVFVFFIYESKMGGVGRILIEIA